MAMYKRKSLQTWTTDAGNMLETPPISHRTARVVCPPLMAICIGGLPTCLYFASVTDQVGIHLALVFTALFLLCAFCLSLRLLLAPYDAKRSRRPGTHPLAPGGVSSTRIDRAGGEQYPLQSLASPSGSGLSPGSIYPFVDERTSFGGGGAGYGGGGGKRSRSDQSPKRAGGTDGTGGYGAEGYRDAHIQGEIGRW